MRDYFPHRFPAAFAKPRVSNIKVMKRQRDSSSSSSSSSDGSSSSDSDSSTNFSSGSSSSGEAPPVAKAPPAKLPPSKGVTKLLVKPNVVVAQAAAAPKGGANRLNSQLTYSHPDERAIPVPPLGQHSSILQLMDADRQLFPFRKFRYVDYFLTACEMFVKEVCDEFAKQKASAEKQDRPYKKFTWGNKGELAICYALTCDMLKLLHDKLDKSKPTWEAIVTQCFHFLIRKSQIPTDILSDQTYRTKYLDWQKGGTRYQGESNNVRFPSAAERLKKLETFVKSGSDYEVQSVVVEAAEVVQEAPPAAAPATVPQPPSGPGPLTRSKLPPSGTAAFKQPHDVKQFNWKAELDYVKGNPLLILLPTDRIHMISYLVSNVCQRCETPDQFCMIVDLINQSPLDVQTQFELQGGLVFVRKWLGSCLRMRNEVALRSLAERTAAMRLRYWSLATRTAWIGQGSNLDWLRAADFLGVRPQMWNETVTRLEALALTPDPSTTVTTTEGSGSKAMKRERTEDDNQKPQGAVVSILRTAPLDPSLVLPVNVNSVERAAFEALLRRRDEFAARRQKLLEQRVLEALAVQAKMAGKDVSDVSLSDVHIPLCYNPYALLGVPQEYVAALM